MKASSLGRSPRGDGTCIRPEPTLEGRGERRGRTNTWVRARFGTAALGGSIGARARPARYRRSEPVVFPTRAGQGPDPLLRDHSVRFFQCYSFGSSETSAMTLRSRAAHRAPRLALSSGVTAAPTTPPAGTAPWGPRAFPAPDPLSPEEAPSVVGPQHSFASFVHTGDVGAGGGPGHCVDGRASKGEIGTRVRPQRASSRRLATGKPRFPTPVSLAAGAPARGRPSGQKDVEEAHPDGRRQFWDKRSQASSGAPCGSGSEGLKQEGPTGSDSSREGGTGATGSAVYAQLGLGDRTQLRGRGAWGKTERTGGSAPRQSLS